MMRKSAFGAALIPLALSVFWGCCVPPKDGAPHMLAALSPVTLGMSKADFETARTLATRDASLGGYEESLPDEFPYFREARYEFESGRLSRIELKRFFKLDEGPILAESSRALFEACRFFCGEPTRSDKFSVRFPRSGEYVYDRFTWELQGSSISFSTTPEATRKKAQDDHNQGVGLGLMLVLSAK